MAEGLSQTVSAGGLGRREQGNQEAGGSAGLEAGEGLWLPPSCQEPFVMRRPQLCDEMA